jgi:hypothetical protein
MTALRTGQGGFELHTGHVDQGLAGRNQSIPQMALGGDTMRAFPARGKHHADASMHRSLAPPPAR